MNLLTSTLRSFTWLLFLLAALAMVEFCLYFSAPKSGLTPPTLERTVFRHNLLEAPRLAVRGKTGGAIQTTNTFQWTQAVISLARFLLLSKSYFLNGQTFVLEGESGSAASSLDFSISKAPQWISDMFGTDSSGMPIIRRLIKRTNPERRRPGPVLITLNEQQIPCTALHIFLNNELLTNTSVIEQLANDLDSSKEQRSENLRAIANHSPNLQNRNEEPSLGKTTELMIREKGKLLHFRDEWLPIVNLIVKDTTSVMRGTVLESEVGAWWNTLAGKMYLANNVQLLRRGVKVKRIFLLRGEANSLTDAALVSALVQEKLGITVRLADPTRIQEKYGISDSMISVHDDAFAAIHRPNHDVPTTELETRYPYISEITRFYDEIITDDQVSAPLSSFLIRAKRQKLLAEKAKEQVDSLHSSLTDGAHAVFMRVIKEIGSKQIQKDPTS